MTHSSYRNNITTAAYFDLLCLQFMQSLSLTEKKVIVRPWHVTINILPTRTAFQRRFLLVSHLNRVGQRYSPPIFPLAESPAVFLNTPPPLYILTYVGLRQPNVIVRYSPANNYICEDITLIAFVLVSSRAIEH